MRRYLVPALVLAFVTTVPAAADETGAETTVADYLVRWEQIDGLAIRKEIEETGTFDATRHPDFTRTIEEMKATANAYRARIQAERAAGQAPHSCLPETQIDLSSDNLIPHLRSYAPDEQANMTLADAFADLMAKTYPCP
ncbi:hypothetical protein [Erythrobacter donghaensis]|uniref:hypothetical protein n=1 Tax=Erythrobacter donghaensis TaxID=267135 RepID=UPI001180BA22|nr:hypothetical protein [Erythrobacter donghaensis]